MSNKKALEVTNETSALLPVAPVLPTATEMHTFHITNPDETRLLANDLAKFIQENKLYHNIQGKEFVNVEGWQYAGSRLGILPCVEEVTRVRDGFTEEMVNNAPEIKYQAKVSLLDLRTGQTVGMGFAICSNKENSKKFYQEFAIASMAQTRAIGKAYRNLLAWIIRAAGYEPTPAEEMDYAAQPLTRELPTREAADNVRPLNGNARPVARQAEAAAPVPTPANATAEPAINIQQKTQILLLLNNPVITKEEKERMVAKINAFDGAKAEQIIEKLNKVINQRRAAGADLSKAA